ncbi:uncharacterized protein LOC134278503 [Saccostrea cucullata]|uniref:uncharacterized protein LOC134278503 n=1 Tax=Saccostrea cuccullata TaxID=36930 RepID=UPI002ED59E27
MQFISTSPESVLNGKRRDWVTNNSTIRLIAVDEPYTVLHWGESASEEDPFRRRYGRLRELRSLVECPVILMTATANSAARKTLQRKFCMTDRLEIIENPDRNSIKLFLQCGRYQMYK